MGKKVFIQSLKWFMPLLFITFINSKALFVHSHTDNNAFVVHSHPFDKNETTTHNHTTKEMIAIEFHTHSLSTTAIIPYIDVNCPLQYLAHKNYNLEETASFQQTLNSNLLRAPPFKV